MPWLSEIGNHNEKVQIDTDSVFCMAFFLVQSHSTCPESNDPNSISAFNIHLWRLGSIPVQSFHFSLETLIFYQLDCTENIMKNYRASVWLLSVFQQTSEKRAASMVSAMRNSSSRAAYCFLLSDSFSCSSASLWACLCSTDETSLAKASWKSVPPGCNRNSSCFLYDNAIKHSALVCLTGYSKRPLSDLSFHKVK